MHTFSTVKPYLCITTSRGAQALEEGPLYDNQHQHHGDINIPKTAKTDAAITSPKVAQSKNEPGILSAVKAVENDRQLPGPRRQ
ncbi:MAG: hypothetical protein ACYDCJ_04250 [Gammaproteobacteria bacterium]